MNDSARTPPRAFALLAGALLAIVAAATTVADDPSTAVDGVQRGRTLYRIYCASCHGEGGRGDGPVAEALKDRPSDLTRIAARHGGDFPNEEVHRAIDGRQPIRAHGASTMPVWGLSFRDAGRDTDQEGEVRARVEALEAYLESIQQREEAPEPK